MNRVLSLPPYTSMRMKESKTGRMMAFDALRRRYVTLTAEEWVRQHFVNYLINFLGYPASLMANEMELRVGEKRLRCDTVVFDKERNPRVIIEYKAPSIAITESVFNQIMAYNTQLGVNCLIMSNGLQHVVMYHNVELGRWVYLPEVPNYAQIDELTK